MIYNIINQTTYRGDIMQYLITYGSQYGSTEMYAKVFSEQTGIPIMQYSEVKKIIQNRIIHFGALYAGGVMGLKSLAAKLAPDTQLIIVTVGLADVKDSDNIKNIQKSIQTQISETLFRKAQIFHLRGAINYEKLNFKHKTMMAMLYAKAKRIPLEEQNAETKAMIETYGKKVDFIDFESLKPVFGALQGKLT